MQNNKSSKMIMITVAIVLFIAAIGFAISTLGNEEEPAIVTPPVESESSTVSEIEVPEESEAPFVDEVPASSVIVETTDSSTGTTYSYTLPAYFSAADVGESGADAMDAAVAINSDVKGWLRIPNTNIDYPVLFHDTDVNYYMAKDLYGNYSKNGVIWADPDTTFGSASEISRNTVLYGHNWTNISNNPSIGNMNDVMFAQLTAFHHLNFASVTPYIHYSTEAEEMTWQVFAAFYTDIDFCYILADPSDTTFASIIEGAKARSRHDYAVNVSTNDKILTLSTCTRAYGTSDRQRFVVMARLMRYDESLTSVAVTTNPDPILPNL